MKIKKDNILNAEEDYILQQCNCITFTSAGLSKQIFEKYPNTNIYKNRKGADIPGDIKICYDKKNIINLFGQYTPGPPKMYETKKQRLEWFEQGIDKIKNIKNINSIAVPYKIGCGLAGGDWNDYYQILEKLDKYINITIYKI